MCPGRTLAGEPQTAVLHPLPNTPSKASLPPFVGGESVTYVRYNVLPMSQAAHEADHRYSVNGLSAHIAAAQILICAVLGLVSASHFPYDSQLCCFRPEHFQKAPLKLPCFYHPLYNKQDGGWSSDGISI